MCGGYIEPEDSREAEKNEQSSVVRAELNGRDDVEDDEDDGRRGDGEDRVMIRSDGGADVIINDHAIRAEFEVTGI